MKKITSIFIALAIMTSMFITNVSIASAEGFDGIPAETLSGGGTLADPYLISDAAELAYARNQINSGVWNTKTFKLTADIDFNNQEWEPIGNGSNVFKGDFNGGGFVVSNLKISKQCANDIYGFFGKGDGGSVKNLGINNIKIQHDYYGTVGCMIGYAMGTDFENCYVVNSSINIDNNCGELGGFVGRAAWGDVVIKNSYVYNTNLGVRSNTIMGGFAGKVDSSNSVSFENCYVAQVGVGAESRTIYGFAAKDNTNATFTNCYSTLCDAQGSVSYDIGKSKGITGATKDAVIYALTSTKKYKVDASINGGYPYIEISKFYGTPATELSGGDGTSADPYLISNAAELAYARNQINSGVWNTKSFKLTADIDFNNQEWVPIGNNTNRFKGTFEGDNHEVSNLKITTGGIEQGFFGYGENGSVKNLGINNIRIQHSTYGGNVGCMIGYAMGTDFENCYVVNSYININNNLGGLGGFVGRAAWNDVVIKNCYVYNTNLGANSGTIMGGFAGKVDSSNNVKFENCYAAQVSEAFTATRTIYGFAAKDNTNATFTNCYSTLSESGSYVSTKVTGITGATKDDIVEGLVTNLAQTPFVLDSSVNNGYPSFPSEAARAVVQPDFDIVSVLPGVSGEGVTVKVARKSGILTTPYVYVATYDTNRSLIEVGVATLDQDDFTFPAQIGLSTVKSVKVFAWNDDQTPLDRCFEGEYTAQGQIIEQ